MKINTELGCKIRESCCILNTITILEIIHIEQSIHSFIISNFRGYSLLVMRIPSLTSLGLRSLRRINDGGVYITGNKKLCYHDTVNWTRILTSSSRPQRQKRQKQIDFKENQLRSQCGE